MSETTHVYIAPNAKGFSCHIVTEAGDAHYLQFTDGNYRTDDAAIAAAIDADMAAGHLSRWVRKVDRSSAEKLVAEHIAARALSGAQVGAATSAPMGNLANLQARDEELHAQPMGAAAGVEAGSGIMLTEAAEAPAKPVIAFGAKGA